MTLVRSLFVACALLVPGLAAAAPGPRVTAQGDSLPPALPFVSQIEVQPLYAQRPICPTDRILVHVNPGTHDFAWNGRRDNGDAAPGAVYFYRATAGSATAARKVVLLGH